MSLRNALRRASGAGLSLLLLLTGCAPRVVEIIREVPVTVTPLPTTTPAPTAAAETATLASLAGLFAFDVPAQTIGGVRIAINGLGLFDRAVLEREPLVAAMFQEPPYRQARAIGFLDITVSNDSANLANVYPDQGVIVIGKEQIDLSRFLAYTTADIGGAIYPGVERNGMLFFAVATSWPDLAAGVDLLLEIKAPRDASYRTLGLGDPYRFWLTLQPL